MSVPGNPERRLILNFQFGLDGLNGANARGRVPRNRVGKHITFQYHAKIEDEPTTVRRARLRKPIECDEPFSFATRPV